MSVKDVNRYYDQICDQYQEMLTNIKDVEKELEQGIVAPELLERLKEQVAPIKQNYERWAYMMFLLRQPTRKSKQKRYQKQNKKLLAKLRQENSVESVLTENTNALKHIGE